MNLTYLIDEDYCNYKKPALFLGTTVCRRNCKNCQNQHLKNADIRKVEDHLLRARYAHNEITKSIVIGGLEPFDTFNELCEFYRSFRRWSKDTIVIYTGYDKIEIEEQVNDLIKLGGHLVIKYGHYIDGQEKHFDDILGVNLASDNQYAEEYNADKS